MAILRTAGGTARTNTGTAGAINLVPLQTIPAGSLVLLGANVNYTTAPGSTPTITATDTQGNSYTTRLTHGYATGAVPNSFLVIIEAQGLARALTIADAITISVSIAADTIDALFIWDSGAAVTGAFDQSHVADSGTSAAGAAADSGATATTTTASEFIWGIIAENGGTGTVTPGAGWTLGQSSSGTASGGTGRRGIFELYQFALSTGSFDAQATLGTVGYWAAAVVTYRSAAVVTSRDLSSSASGVAGVGRDVPTDASLVAGPSRDVTGDASILAGPARDVTTDASVTVVSSSLYDSAVYGTATYAGGVASQVTRDIQTTAAVQAGPTSDVGSDAASTHAQSTDVTSDASVAGPVAVLVSPFTATTRILEAVGSFSI